MPARDESSISGNTTYVLLDDLRKGGSQDQVWGEFHERYRDKICAYAYGQMGPAVRRHFSVDDVVNLAWMRVIKETDQFVYRRRHALYHWLRLQVRRTILDCERSLRHRKVESVMSIPDATDSTRGPETRADEGEVCARLDEALRRVPGTYRKALELIHYKSYSHEDAAAALGISRNNLSQRLHRGKQLWRREYRELAKSA